MVPPSAAPKAFSRKACLSAWLPGGVSVLLKSSLGDVSALFGGSTGPGEGIPLHQAHVPLGIASEEAAG